MGQMWIRQTTAHYSISISKKDTIFIFCWQVQFQYWEVFIIWEKHSDLLLVFEYKIFHLIRK